MTALLAFVACQTALLTQKQVQAVKPYQVVVLSSKPQDPKFDWSAVTDYKKHASDSEMDFQLVDNVAYLIERTLYESEISADLDEIQKLIRDSDKLPRSLRLSQLSTAQANAICRSILRSPFGGSYSKKAIDKFDLRFGLGVSVMADVVNGASSKQMRFAFDDAKEFDGGIYNPELPFGERALRAMELIDTPLPAPAIQCYVWPQLSDRERSAVLALGMERLVELANREDERLKLKIQNMAYQGLGVEKVPKDSVFSKLPAEVQSKLLQDVRARFNRYGFANPESAASFLAGSALSNVKVSLMITIGVVREGRRLDQSFTLAAVRT